MPKYCVYDKGPNNPIEVWEYIDNVKVASSYWYVQMAIDKYGVDDVMPICMNKCGGYHTFWEPDCIAIIESDTWPTIATHKELFSRDVNNPHFDCGWIDTLGNTYICNYMGHARLAESLVEMIHKEEYLKWRRDNALVSAPDDFLFEKGWIKVLNGSPNHIVFYDKTTDAAIKKLEEVEERLGRK